MVVEDETNNRKEDRPSTTELLGASKEQIDRQGKSIDTTAGGRKPYEEGGKMYQTFIGTASIILVILGIVALGALVLMDTDSENEQPKTVIRPTSLITVVTDREVVVGSTPVEEQINTINEMVSLSPDSFLQIYFTTQENEEKQLLSSEDFMRSLPTVESFPLDLYLEDDFTYGSYIDADRNVAPYLIFAITDYGEAYGTMLEMESRLGEQLQPLGFPNVNNFSDTIIQNQDVRFATETSGEQGIYYAFPGQDNLVITTTRSALETIFRRLR